MLFSLWPWPVTSGSSRQSPFTGPIRVAHAAEPGSAALKPRKTTLPKAKPTSGTHEQMDATMPASIAAFLCLLSVAAAMDPAERGDAVLVMDAVSSDRDWRLRALTLRRALAGARVQAGAWQRRPAARHSAGLPAWSPTRARTRPPSRPRCSPCPASNPLRRSLQQPGRRHRPRPPVRQPRRPPCSSSASGPTCRCLASPPQLVRLRSLQVLTISQNGLVRGEIPQGIGELKSLVHLDLSYNSLSGPVPSRISELQGLVGLDLSYNSLSAPSPAGSATCASCRSWT
ncbi:hypothetical protein ZWY2020_006948 [Hordeum vulgare]|nr:hypothetical protein ZWY2020_006948 [Hordeum vulgare]